MVYMTVKSIYLYYSDRDFLYFSVLKLYGASLETSFSDKKVEWHITHKYYDAMSLPSTCVS